MPKLLLGFNESLQHHPHTLLPEQGLPKALGRAGAAGVVPSLSPHCPIPVSALSPLSHQSPIPVPLLSHPCPLTVPSLFLPCSLTIQSLSHLCPCPVTSLSQSLFLPCPLTVLSQPARDIQDSPKPHLHPHRMGRALSPQHCSDNPNWGILFPTKPGRAPEGAAAIS